MSTQLRADLFIDAKGQMCPMPILTLKKAWKDVAVGQIVAIAATDQGARRDIPSWAEATGNTFLGMTEEQGVLTFYLQKVA
jgi:tRNA 2-thiouridine synthesizing protein A